MIYVGIDVAKINHFASAIQSDDRILIEPFKFTNDVDGFQLLSSKLYHLDRDSLIIDLESTAHYGDNLIRYLVAENYIQTFSNTLSEMNFYIKPVSLRSDSNFPFSIIA